MMHKIPTVPLPRTNDGFPLFGLGVWKAAKGETAAIVEAAIKRGVRHIDGACDYGNEQEVGQAIKKCIDEGVCKREDLWITSKLWNTFHAKEHVEAAARKSLADLGLDYFDLYLVHFPISLKYVPFEKRYPPEWIHDPSAPHPRMELADVPYQETWQAMEELVDKGLARNIGVSNLTVQLLMDVLRYARIRPAVNQVELHPFLTQERLLEYCKHEGVVVTAYSPLGSASYVSIGMDGGHGAGPLQNGVIKGIANKIGKSPAQVILRWGVQRGTVVIPKTSKPERLDENAAIFDFELSEEDMAAISALNINARFNNPAIYCKAMGAICPIFD